MRTFNLKMLCVKTIKTQIVRNNFLLEYISEIYSTHGQLFFIKSLLEHVMPVVRSLLAYI